MLGLDRLADDAGGLRRDEGNCRPRHAVRIEKGLRRRSPENGNILGIGRRLSGFSRDSCGSSESRDTAANSKNPYILRDFCDFRTDYLKLIDCLAGAGGIEPCNNPLPHKDFSIPARPFDSIFDSKAKALVGMTDDEMAYIEAKGWKASVVPG